MILPRQPGSTSLWKQRNRREARTAAQDCGELLLEQARERGKSLEKDADARKQVLTVKCHGPANQQLEGGFPVIQVGCVGVGTSMASAVLGVMSGVAEHSSIVPMGCSSPLAMRPRNAGSHDPGSDASKCRRLPEPSKEEEAVLKACRDPRWEKSWLASPKAFGNRNYSDRAPGHGSLHLAVPWIFTG